MKILKTRMKQYRAKFGLTQEDLARLVEVRRETITHLERGKYNPSLKLAHDIAEALHAKIDEIFYYEEAD